MKIFYAVQATGNGHISRAREIIPLLSKYGEVDVFLSGNNYGLKNDLPVAYRSKGVSLHYDKSYGKVDLKKTLLSINIKKVIQEAFQLPVEKYNLIINDFECITSLACRFKKIPSIHFGHQASFSSNLVPRPEKKSAAGEFVLKHYAQSTMNIGLHFSPYDQQIFNPIIKNEIINADPRDKGHITVYLGHIDDSIIEKQLTKISDFQFEVFSGKIKEPIKRANIQFYPVNQSLFNHSLINCKGIITGSGFETPAEALYMEKKIMVFPMKGQYEQQCNAAALKQFGVPILEVWNDSFQNKFENWINGSNHHKLEISDSAEDIISRIFELPQVFNVKQQKSLHKDAEPIHQQFRFWERAYHQSTPISSLEYKSIKQEQ
jgi:uncharacterized protein (TIGR00661 family)